MSVAFPKQHITVTGIQSHTPKEKQYFYYVRGSSREFDVLLRKIKMLKGYSRVEVVDRSKESLQLLVVLHQETYVQTVIQNNHGFLIDFHTVIGGWEYWHVGVTDKKNIVPMIKKLKTMGEYKTLMITKTEFAPALLSPQQKRVFQLAFDQGYYETPRRTTMANLAKTLRLSTATVGEHLSKAENKMIVSVAKRL